MNTKRYQPKLKQESDLNSSDFEMHGVWRNVHGVDQCQEWYDSNNCNESTYRPWDEAYPVELKTARVILVAAVFTLKNGDQLKGYLRFSRPISSTNTSSFSNFVTGSIKIGDCQPKVFVENQVISFWTGLLPIDLQMRQTFYSVAQAQPRAIFPISFATKQGLLHGIVKGRLQGFYRLEFGDENRPAKQIVEF